MRIFAVPQNIDTVSEVNLVNVAAGVELSVRECADKSGFIGKLIDFFTGDLIKNFYGDTVEVAVFAADTHVSKHEYWKHIA